MRSLMIAAGAAALAAAGATAQDAEVRFYDVETFTVVYELTGAESGTVTEHVRDWGRVRVEVKDTEVGVAGFTQSSSQRVIYDQDQIFTVDLNTNAVTIATNPMWQTMVDGMNGQSGVEVGQQMITAMGGSPTGETASYAGVSCDVWNVPNLGSTVCVTPEGITLSSSTNMMGMSSDRVATEVRMGDGGPDDAFAYDAGAATTMPDLSTILGGFGQGD